MESGQRTGLNNVETDCTVRQLEDSHLLREDWAELLSSAPLCLELLGSLGITATSGDASGLTLSAPVSGFKHLQYLTAQGALSQIIHQGFNTFNIAHTGMVTFSQHSKLINQELEKVSRALRSEDAPIAVILQSLEGFKAATATCQKVAHDSESAFDTWIEIVQEALACCKNDIELLEAKLPKVNQRMARAWAVRAVQEEAYADSQTKLEKFEKNIEESNRNYQKCQENCTTPATVGSLLAFNAVDEAGKVVTEIGEATINATNGIANLVWKEFMALGNIPAKAYEKAVGALSDRQATAEAATEAAAQKLRTAFMTGLGCGWKEFDGNLEATDPTIPELETIKKLVAASYALMFDPIYGGQRIDWHHIDQTPTGSGRSATEVSHLLEKKLKALRNPNTTVSYALPTQLAERSLKECRKVVEEMLHCPKDAANRPAETSDVPANWAFRLKLCHDVMQELTEVLKKVSKTKLDEFQILPILEKRAELPSLGLDVMKQSIAAAQEHLKVAASLHQSNLSVYQTLQQHHGEIQQEVTKARADVKELEREREAILKGEDNGGMNLKNSRRVLAQLLGSFVPLKLSIYRLSQFFRLIAIQTDQIAETVVEPLYRNISSLKGDAEGLRQNKFSHNMISEQLLLIASSFDMLRETAKLYCLFHNSGIVKGLKAADDCATPPETKLSDMSPDERIEWQRRVESRVVRIQGHCKEFGETIAKIVTTKQNAIREGLQKRVEATAAEITGTVPTSNGLVVLDDGACRAVERPA
ncbi:hypothetical protein BJ508DRAFT_301487 [Ascobolus immersus RN42]|uniref:Uncharacterized protein n=1 Tax=Ascobolus immersus RN42 TaxID=1160509 RepID=A0A3N4ILB0_ASCIM|nr:hypothetical protein BJ508DRAFT_301487 [Ascobolus immersus RN42]